jgi:hypothetical protein
MALGVSTTGVGATAKGSTGPPEEMTGSGHGTPQIGVRASIAGGVGPPDEIDGESFGGSTTGVGDGIEPGTSGNVDGVLPVVATALGTSCRSMLTGNAGAGVVPVTTGLDPPAPLVSLEVSSRTNAVVVTGLSGTTGAAGRTAGGGLGGLSEVFPGLAPRPK